MFGSGLFILLIGGFFAFCVLGTFAIFIGVMVISFKKLKEHNENKIEPTTANSKTVEQVDEEKVEEVM